MSIMTRDQEPQNRGPSGPEPERPRTAGPDADPGKGTGTGGGTERGGVTRLAQPHWIAYALTVLGAGLAWAVTLLADRLVEIPLIPFERPLELLGSVPQPWLTVGALCAGGVVGLLGGAVILHHELSLSVSAERTVLTREDRSRDIPRERIGLVCRDGKQLVVFGHEGEELAREECDLDAGRLAAAFTSYGYRWAAEDPYRDAFRRWVPDAPGLPAGADPLLRARDRTLRKSGADTADARELREELARLGVFVREVDKRQFWRTAPGPDRGQQRGPGGS
ncbi:hypothetical protein D7M15_19175 [Streptomyces sp. Z26]|nr:hypothetical protein D7M15_19175 [Streptomyces sp. Z26]